MNPPIRLKLQTARETIRSGGVVAYPTESCFGLGCDPRDHAAVRKILALKRRPASKGLILIAARYEPAKTVPPGVAGGADAKNVVFLAICNDLAGAGRILGAGMVKG